MIGAEADLLSQDIEREVLAEMSSHEIRHAFYLVAGQPLQDLFDLPGCGSIMTQEVYSKPLSSSLCVEFSGRGILLQFSPQRESDLRQQWVLEARVPYQGQASRITVCFLLGSAGKPLRISVQTDS